MKPILASTFALFALHGLSEPAVAQPSDELLLAASARCAQYGFAPGSDGLARCVQGLVEGLSATQQQTEARKRRVARCKENMMLPGSDDMSFGGVMIQQSQCDSGPTANTRRQRGMTCDRNFNGSVTCSPD